ncbi:MAG: sugar phosphate isomerase/epimerase [Gemmataceae bacterium]|nr:sugar phosphate isomerase/epimerase [Gemmataceae bacterium]MCS7270639.1 sugar phosphate isomerase/epimerase [Gemmataceae bacterium]MDW8244186.1 sugar phosphate isomerase/epimerase family protein [Thermogemmata sp.]
MHALRLGLVLESTGLPVREAVAEAARLGVSGVQVDATGPLAPDSLSATGRREFLQLLRSSGLELAAVNVPLRRGLDVADGQQARIEHIGKVLRLAADLHCGRVVLPCPRLPQEPDTPRSRTLQETLTDLARQADYFGIVLALELGWDGAEAVVRYLSSFDTAQLKVTYDPANYLVHGYDPLAELSRLSGWVVHVHARDACPAGLARGQQEVPLGAGEVDWLTLTATLQVFNYQGVLAVERLEGDNRLADVRAGVAFLRRFLLPAQL